MSFKTCNTIILFLVLNNSACCFSTDAVFAHGMKDCAEDSDMFAHADDLQDGYSQSKWVAEQLVIRAMERGLPAAVYRPGTHINH